MNHLIGYKCSICGQEYGPTEEYVCPKHGDEGLLDAVVRLARLIGSPDAVVPVPSTPRRNQERQLHDAAR